ncbi:Pxr1, partial [Ophiophagus hannah]
MEGGKRKKEQERKKERKRKKGGQRRKGGEREEERERRRKKERKRRKEGKKGRRKTNATLDCINKNIAQECGSVEPSGLNMASKADSLADQDNSSSNRSIMQGME